MAGRVRAPLDRPTARELEVLAELAAGWTVAAVAARLGMAPATVSSHVHHVRLKLGSRTRTGAVATAIRRGLI